MELGRPVAGRAVVAKLPESFEDLGQQIPAVEHVYSTSGDGWALVTVRFKVGEDLDRSVSAVHAKLASAGDRAPPGMLPPLVVAHSIDDVPFLALTLHSASDGPDLLRQVAAHLADEIATISDVGATTIIGGRPRQLRRRSAASSLPT